MEKYYRILIRWFWVILLAAALSAVAAYISYNFNRVQQYEASSGIYISKVSIDSKDNPFMAYNDLLGAELVATDCKSIIPSDALMTKLAKTLDMPLDVVRNGFSVRNGGSARIVVVSSTGVDPERAKTIVESAVTMFIKESGSYLPGVTFKRLDDVMLSAVKSKIQIYMAGAAIVGACFSVGCILLASALISARKARMADSAEQNTQETLSSTKA